MSADVEEAADDQAAQRHPRRDPGVHRHPAPAREPGSSGSGNSVELMESVTRPDSDSSYGVPPGSTGMPGSTPAATSICHDRGSSPSLSGKGVDPLLQVLDLIQRVELAAA